MSKSLVLSLLAVLAIAANPVAAVGASEGDLLPPQIPARTASGATNINDVWLHNGGGRLYQNTLVTPRQIALEGARFVDPASVPELALTPPADKKAPVRHTRKTRVAKAAPAGTAAPVTGTPPKGVGKTSLKTPDKAPAAASATAPAKAPANTTGAIPPLSAAGAAPATAGGGAAGVESPYSSAAVSPVGGIGSGGAAPGAAFGAQGAGDSGANASATPVPPISADNLLPRANARP